MLNHTYTSIKNANLVDSGNTQHITSQPSALIKSNYLGEFRTELDKKKVLANLGIATSLSLEWEYIKGDIGRSAALMQELDTRTKYTSQLDGLNKTIADGIKYLESIVGSEEDVETEQNNKIEALETSFQNLQTSINELKDYLNNTVDVNIETLEQTLQTISEKVNNITTLIQVSSKAGNALSLVGDSDVEEGETTGLYVPDLSLDVETAKTNIEELQSNVTSILDTYVTKEQLGGSDFNFVNQSDFEGYTTITNESISNIQQELNRTVKTGEDGHVDQLYVNKITKNNNDDNIKLSDSFEVESGIPLDIRFVREDLEQLLQLPVEVCYPGMGVIINSLSALYILRKPGSGITFNQEYISDINNWKCPEDLVIEVLTQEEYDKKVEENSINPNMFYYIHEEVTEEPVLEDFNGDEEAYKVALNKWLRVLQQKYMSAVWGQEIEELVASKASNTAIKSLETEIQRLSALIDGLSGGSSSVNLKDLNDQVSTNTTNIENLIKEDGTIPTLQKDLSDLQNTVTSDYVTKTEITTENPEVEYIFVKKSAFNSYTEQHKKEIEKSLTTEQLNTTEVTLSDNVLTTQENNLLFNNEKVALDKQVPVIEIMDNTSYEALPEKDPEKYYYVYENEERYVLDSEFSEYKSYQSNTIATLSESINTCKKEIGNLEGLSTENKNTIVFAINELFASITSILTDLTDLKTRVSNLETI